MNGFTPPAESHGFHPGLWSGCRATKSRRSRSKSAKLSVATGLSAAFLAEFLGKGVLDDQQHSCFSYNS